MSLGWFVAQVTPRHEKKTGMLLGYKNYEHFVPLYKVKRKWSDRFKVVEEPLFPGYIFFRSGRSQLGVVIATPGIVRIVSFGGVPSPVADEEIEALQRINGCARDLCPSPYINIGQKVMLVAGPLAGLTGLVTYAKNGRRLIVSVDAIARSISVEIDASEIAGLSMATA